MKRSIAFFVSSSELFCARWTLFTAPVERVFYIVSRLVAVDPCFDAAGGERGGGRGFLPIEGRRSGDAFAAIGCLGGHTHAAAFRACASHSIHGALITSSLSAHHDDDLIVFLLLSAFCI